MTWNQGLYLVERNTAEICQALDDLWEKIQSEKCKKETMQYRFLCWSHWSHQEQVNAPRLRSCVYFWEPRLWINLGFPSTTTKPAEPTWVQVIATGFSLNWFPGTNARHQHVLVESMENTSKKKKGQGQNFFAIQRRYSDFWYPDTFYPGFAVPK